MSPVRSIVPMKIAKIGYMVISFSLGVLGITLIAVPTFSIRMFAMYCGALMVAFGIIRLIGFFSKDLFRLAFQYDLAFGILIIVFGVLMLVNTERIMPIICIPLGFLVLTDSVFKALIAMDAKRFGIHVWWLICAFAVAAGLFSLVLIFWPSTGSNLLGILLGTMLLLEGVLNFTTVVAAVKIIKNQRPDNMEIDDEESED